MNCAAADRHKHREPPAGTPLPLPTNGTDGRFWLYGHNLTAQQIYGGITQVDVLCSQPDQLRIEELWGHWVPVLPAFVDRDPHFITKEVPGPTGGWFPVTQVYAYP